MMGRVKLPMRDLTRQITVEVDLTGLRVFALRRWLGLVLIRWGVRVLGYGCRVTGPEDEGK